MKLIIFILLLISNTTFAYDLSLGYPLDEPVHAVAAKLLVQICKHAGISLKVESMPAARIPNEIKNKTLDGEISRVEKYYEKHPEIIKITPSYYSIKTTYFINKKRKLKFSLGDINKYTVGVLRGVVHSNTAAIGAKEIILMNSIDDLFKLLSANKMDVVIDADLNAIYSLAKLGLKNEIMITHSNKRLPLFAGLNEDKKKFIPLIAKAIKEMNDSGELGKLIIQYEKEVLAL